MKRGFCFSFLTICIFALSVSGADVEIAPAPREIKADGTREPAPVPKQQNPLETVERIIKNSKAVGDKLAMTDTGIDTRKAQDNILKDIQSLIDRQENPPPKSGQSADMNNDNKSGNKSDMDNMPPQKDQQSNDGMNQPPMGNDSDKPKERRPRQQSGDKPKEQGNNPMNQDKNPSSNNSPSKQPAGSSQNSKQVTGRKPDPMSDGKLPPPMPSLPPEETMKKDVWGYLPDKLRQQAMQYYKQEFMPRYEKLLEHYYSSLSEKKK